MLMLERQPNIVRLLKHLDRVRRYVHAFEFLDVPSCPLEIVEFIRLRRLLFQVQPQHVAALGQFAVAVAAPETLNHARPGGQLRDQQPGRDVPPRLDDLRGDDDSAIRLDIRRKFRVEEHSLCGPESTVDQQ